MRLRRKKIKYSIIFIIYLLICAALLMLLTHGGNDSATDSNDDMLADYNERISIDTDDDMSFGYVMDIPLNDRELNVLRLIMVFISCFIGACMINFFPIIVFMISVGTKSAKKEKLTAVDFGKYKGYYRDIIKGYSPAVLGFIDSFETEKKILLQHY